MHADVLVIGGNPGGCAAAISAARSGLSVVLLEHTSGLGGMNANGTFRFDCATPQALSGIALEVDALVRRHYARAGCDDPLAHRRTNTVWESHVAARAWHELVSGTPGLQAITGAVPVGVAMVDGRIAEVRWQHAADPMGNLDPGDARVEVVRPRLVIDASYYADVVAWSGAPFRIGREPRSALEPHAGRLFASDQRPSRDGVPAHSVLPGSTGEGGEEIMAFALRLHCRFHDDASPHAPHRLAAPPSGYDATRYRWASLGVDAQGQPVYFNSLQAMPNRKFMLNRLVHGNNLVGPNRAYVLAHPRERKALRQQFIDHALGFLYFIQHEGGTPALGLAEDEFTDNARLPRQIYVREGRRIEGREMLTEANVNPYIAGDGLRPPLQRDAIAIGDWTIESHGCTDDVPPDRDAPEGMIFSRVAQAPYQVPYGCLLPSKVDNLLVCGAVSATHVAAGAVRCEGARIQLGTAAGVAAGLALRLGVAPADVPVDDLQRELVARGVKLCYFRDVDGAHPEFAAIQWAALRGWVPPDPQWRFEPERAVDGSEFVRATVACLGLPISVTGAHFTGVHRHHPCFRFVETLYDLGTRAGVDVFGFRDLAGPEPMAEFLRLHPEPALIPFAADAPMAHEAAHRILARVAEAFGAAAPPLAAAGQGALTRAQLCAALRAVWDRLSEGFAR